MPRLVARLVLFAGLMANLPAQTPPGITVTAVSVESPAVLPADTPVYVRVSYRSDQPLRVQAAGYVGTHQNKQAFTNPSPVYPAGTGEAVAWISYKRVIRNPINEIRVTAFDASWKPLQTVTVPVHLGWDSTQAGPAPAMPAWAQELSKAQQTAVSEDMKRPVKEAPGWTSALTMFLFASVPGYALLQIFALIKLRGTYRVFGALPLVVMLPVYAFCLYALAKESNLWPIYAIFCSPPAFLFVALVLVVSRFKPQVRPADS